MASGTESIQATKTSFSLLETLVDRSGSAGVTDLARLTGVTKSTAYKHLDTLVQLGLVEKDADGYRPSIRLLDFGEHVRQETPVYGTVKPYVDKLAELSNETAGVVTVRDDTLIDVYAGTGGGDSGFPCNTRFLHCTAPGKAILAEYEDDELDRYLDETRLPELTDHTLTGADELHDELTRVRERGIAFEREEQYEGVNSVAVCIPDCPEIAVYVSGPVNDLSGKRFDENIPGILMSTAQEIAQSLD